MNMENWETNLRDGFSQYGMNNSHYWNGELIKWVKDWRIVAVSIDNVGIVRQSFDTQNNSIDLEVKLKESDLKFVAKMGFFTDERDEFKLKISAIEMYNLEFPEFHPQWTEDIIDGIEIREKGFVLQLLNKRLFTYLSWFDVREDYFEEHKK